MIYAILEDYKGFRKMVEMPWKQPEFRIPVYKRTAFLGDELGGAMKTTYVAFHFHSWINEENRIALYKEL